MRVSPRWFIWFCLAALIFIALVLSQMPKQSRLRMASLALLALGVVELFALNLGYQNRILNHNPVTAPQATAHYTFGQTLYLGHDCTLPNGDELPSKACTNDAYREYEATTFNLGTLYANDAFVQLALTPAYQSGHPTCPYKDGCSFVASGNAKVSHWSPQRITLERTANGPIKLNMNNSNYFIINGKRNSTLKVAEPLIDFVIYEPDSTKIITLTVRPSFKPGL